MASCSIPGLNNGPIDDSEDVPGIALMSFGGEPFIIPASHLFGKCRLITEFEKIGLVGEGAYGSVYKVKDKKQNNKIVALKKLNIPKEPTGFPRNFLREINLMRNLRHENIVSLHGVAVGKAFDSTYLILEYCPYELWKLLDDEETKLSIRHSHVKCIMYQLFFGLSFLHENEILHRDLTVTNILFSDEGFLKIADYGNCRMTSEDEMTPNVVTRWYRPPELLFGATFYTKAVDIWSAGCIFAELLLKRPLFKGDTDISMISMLVDLLGSPNEDTWPGYSSLPVMEYYNLSVQPVNKLTLTFAEQPATCITLLHKILKYNPSTRITADECLDNSYFDDDPLAYSLEALLALLKKVDEI